MEVMKEDVSEMKVLSESKKMWWRYIVNYGKMELRHEGCEASQRQYGMLLFGTVDNVSGEANVSGVISLRGGSSKNDRKAVWSDTVFFSQSVLAKEDWVTCKTDCKHLVSTNSIDIILEIY